MRTVRFVLRVILPGLLFIAAGVLHFAKPALYLSIVPPHFGDPATIVKISGAAEIAGGLGLLVPATRHAAGTGVIALLIAVWPANWWMAIKAADFASVAPAWVIWLRVPLQLPLIWWIDRARRRAN